MLFVTITRLNTASLNLRSSFTTKLTKSLHNPQESAEQRRKPAQPGPTHLGAGGSCTGPCSGRMSPSRDQPHFGCRTWGGGRRETNWFETLARSLPGFPSRSHSRLPGPWDTPGVSGRPVATSRDGPLVTLQQLKSSSQPVRTRDTWAHLSSRLQHGLCRGHTPPARDQAGRGRGGRCRHRRKVGRGAGTHPTPEKAKPQRGTSRTLEGPQHSRTSTSQLPAHAAKVASLHVQTVSKSSVLALQS